MRLLLLFLATAFGLLAAALLYLYYTNYWLLRDCFTSEDSCLVNGVTHSTSTEIYLWLAIPFILAALFCLFRLFKRVR